MCGSCQPGIVAVNRDFSTLGFRVNDYAAVGIDISRLDGFQNEGGYRCLAGPDLSCGLHRIIGSHRHGYVVFAVVERQFRISRTLDNSVNIDGGRLDRRGIDPEVSGAPAGSMPKLSSLLSETTGFVATLLILIQ